MFGRSKALLIGCVAALLLATPTSAGATADLARVEAASWTDYVRALWPIFAVVGGLIATGILLGLATRFVTLKAFESLKSTVEKLESKVTTHDRRIQATESQCALKPSPQDIQEDLAELGERMKGVEVAVSGVSVQMGTMNTYIHSLIDKDIRR